MACSPDGGYSVRDAGTHWVIAYAAMASPCRILVPCSNASEARKLASLAYQETARIECKFSRYRSDNVVHAINHGNGASITIDEETSRLLHYAAQCHRLSDGRFDVTSGVLRRAWNFDGRDVTPDDAKIALLREYVGWERVVLGAATIRLEPGMEIDLGGIGKEYAVDRVAARVAAEANAAVLANFGGDIRVVAHPRDARTWSIGIESPREDDGAVGQIELAEGGVATSGDARRFCTVAGKRLGHILDPRTGWPVEDAPRSVTVVADTCTAAGFLATMAMLHGSEAEDFLDAQRVRYHCIR